jgi:tetratricopeptide (TPR) repeat protein
VALLVRVAYIVLEVRHTALFSFALLDEQEVMETAHGLLESQGFGQEPLFRAPGYPILVAAAMVVFGDGWNLGLRLLQAIGGACLVASGASLARLLAPPGQARPWAAMLTGLLLTIHGPAIRLESTISLDGPAAAAFAAMMTLLATTIRVLETGRERKPSLAIWKRWKPVQSEWAQKLALGAGGCGMLLALLRPTVVPLTMLLAIAIFLRFFRQPGRRLAMDIAALIAGPTLLAGVAVTLRNGNVTNEWRTMPLQGGFNLREANRLDGPRGRYLTQRPIAALPDRSEVANHPLFQALRERQSANPTREIAFMEYLASSPAARSVHLSKTPFSEMDRWHLAQLVQSISVSPLSHALLYGQKLLEIHSDREIFNYEDYATQAQRSTFLSAMTGRVGILLPLAAFSLGLAFVFPRLLTTSRTRALLWICFGTIMMTALTALGFSSGRMRMPLIAPWAALAGCTPVFVAAALARRLPLRTRETPKDETKIREAALLSTNKIDFNPAQAPKADLSVNRVGWRFINPWTVALSLALGAAGLSWQDVTGVRSERNDYHDLCRMSNAAWHAGQSLENRSSPGESIPEKARTRYHEALILARQARLAAPQQYPIPIRLEAQALSALGRATQAVGLWRSAAALLPADASIHQNLATTLFMDLGQTTESIPVYREAMRLGSTEARFFLAIAYIRLGQTEAAADALSPLADVLRMLESQPATPGRNVNVPARAIIAGSLLAEAQGRARAAENLAGHLGPRGRTQLLQEQQFLPRPAGPSLTRPNHSVWHSSREGGPM